MSSLSVLQGLASYVLPSHLLEYFDLVRVEERPVPEVSRMGVESGELVFHLEERDGYRSPEDGTPTVRTASTSRPRSVTFL